MNSMREKKNTALFKLLYSLLLNVGILVFYLIVYSLNYEMADDAGYADWIANGCYDFHFISYLYCAFVGFIQNIIYPLNAYVLVFLFLSLCAFTAITVVFTDKFNAVVATFFTLFITGFFAVNHYEQISFTRMPALLTVAGFLCIIHYVNKDKYRLGVCVGAAFVLIGSLIRFMIFEASLAMVCFYVVGKSLSEYFAIEKGARKIKELFFIIFEKRRLIVAISLVALCFGINITENFIVKQNDGLSYYCEYTAARSAVWDYPIPDYEQCKEEYDKIGIDANDIEMLRQGYLDDKGAFSLEKLKEIKSIQQNYNSQNKSYIGILKNMIVDEIGGMRALADKGIALFAFGIILLSFIILMKKRNYFIPLCLGISVFGFYYYLWFSSKVPYRAVYVLLLAATVYLLYSFSITEFKCIFSRLYFKYRKVNLAVLLLLAIPLFLVGNYLSNKSNVCFDCFRFSQDQMDLQKYIDDNKDKKLELSRTVSLPKGVDSIIYVSRESVTENSIYFNCTYGKLPYYMQEVKDFGTDNLYSYLLEDGVYFVDDSPNPQTDMMKTYLEKYYGSGNNISVQKTDVVGEYYIYKFSLQ